MSENRLFNIFETLQKDDKELIHSSFVCFLMNEYKEFYKKVLDLDYSVDFLENIQAETEISLGREFGRADILVQNAITIIIENKFKSFPSEEQLIKYNDKFPDNDKTHKYLLTFDKSIVSIKSKDLSTWIVIDYKQILDFCKTINSIETNPDKQIFINHYISFISNYIDEFNRISTDSEYLKQKLSWYDKNTTFWRVIIFSLIQSEIEQKIDRDNYSISVFSGRQLSPGLNILIKNEKLKPIKSINALIWYELQGNLLKVKLSGNVYNDRDKLIDKMINKGFSRADFAKKGSKKVPSTFTLYQIPLELSDWSISNIADKYIDFVKEIELKMNE